MTYLNLKISHSIELFDALQKEINGDMFTNIDLFEYEHYQTENDVYTTDFDFYNREQSLYSPLESWAEISSIVNQNLPIWYHKYLQFCFWWQNLNKTLKRE